MPSALSRAPLALSLLLALAPAAACHGQDAPAAQSPLPAGPTEKDKTFMAENALAKGVVNLPSGLQYKIVHSGPANGPHPTLDDEVKVNYEGTLLSGRVFDSSFARGEPAVMPLGGLIEAWREALPLMRPGDEWLIYVPPKLGYGDRGAGGGEIPGGAVLVFRLQLLGVLSHGGGTGAG